MKQYITAGQLLRVLVDAPADLAPGVVGFRARLADLMVKGKVHSRTRIDARDLATPAQKSTRAPVAARRGRNGRKSY